MTMGTFHYICMGLLRTYVHLLGCGLDNRFTIADSDDSKSEVRGRQAEMCGGSFTVSVCYSWA